MFWKSIKPLFTGKSKSQTNITLVENEQIITEKVEVAEKLNNYFIEAVQNLQIETFNTDGEKIVQGENIDAVITKIVEKYFFHSGPISFAIYRPTGRPILAIFEF